MGDMPKASLVSAHSHPACPRCDVFLKAVPTKRRNKHWVGGHRLSVDLPLRIFCGFRAPSTRSAHNPRPEMRILHRLGLNSNGGKTSVAAMFQQII